MDEPMRLVPDGLAAADAPSGVIDRLMQMFQAGGPVVAILVGLSVLACTIVFAKLWQFRHARAGDTATARRALARYRAGRLQEALDIALASPNPAARALAGALRGRQRRLPEAAVREEILRFGTEMLDHLRSWLRPLEVIASLAPLLGLFGTVLGMIEAFQNLEQAGSRVDPSVLSGGIWQALLTTAVGLAVAMPVVVAHTWLERRVDRLAQEMESIITQVFTPDLSAATAAPAHPADQDVLHAPAPAA
ncbi:MAG: MotA/TolQ/ExbB proton channel family protein [Rhodospirillaceae bacterium]|nr:MotA/TolQ/ExbB proton channel family protein [Rhodospirillaceae bacterium]